MEEEEEGAREGGGVYMMGALVATTNPCSAN